MDRTRDRLGSCRDAVHERLQSADPEQRLSPSRPRARASPPICAEGFNARTGAVSGHAGGVVEGASARLCWPCLFTERCAVVDVSWPVVESTQADFKRAPQ